MHQVWENLVYNRVVLVALGVAFIVFVWVINLIKGDGDETHPNHNPADDTDI